MAAISDKVSTPLQNGDGTNKVFAFDFSIIAAGDIGVYVDGVEKDYPDDYGVVFGDTSGTVTFHEAPAEGTRILLVSQPDYSQTSAFADQGAYNLSTVNTINRRATIRNLVTEDKASRALKVPLGEAPPEMDSLAGADGKVLGILNGRLAPFENTTAAVASNVAAAAAARLQTGLDAVATADDREAVAADRLATQVALGDARDVVQEVSDALALGTISDLVGTRIYTSQAALFADLVPADNLYALVVGDPVPANNDLYQKDGATGAGAWDGPLGFFKAASSEAKAYRDETDEIATALRPLFPEISHGLGSRSIWTKLVEGTGSVRPQGYHPYSFTAGKIYQVRALVKKAERPFFGIYSSTGLLVDACFDISAGKVARTGTGTTAEIRSIGNGVYLCIATRTATVSAAAAIALSSGVTNFAGITPHTGDGVSGVYIGAASMTEAGSLTELLTSRFINEGPWTQAQASLAQEIVENTSPAGGLAESATEQLNGVHPVKITEASGASLAPTLYRPAPVIAGKTYRSWAIVRADERSRLNIYCNIQNPFDATFDLSAGTCSGAGARISARGDGEYLCEVFAQAATSTVTPGPTPNLQFRIFPTLGGHPYAGDGVSGLHMVAAGQDEDGVSKFSSEPGEFLGPSWLKQAVTVALDTSLRMNSIASRLDGLEARPSGGGETPQTKPLQGRKWAALGSSITDQEYYTTPLAAMSGMALTNLGFSGGALGVATTGHYGSQKIYDAIASIPLDSEIVTIECGVNDFPQTASAVALGALGDTTINTFYGAVYAAAAAVYARVPNAKLLFLTPYGSGSNNPNYTVFATNNAGAKLVQFQKAILEVAGMLGIACIDVGRNANIGYLNANSITADGLHINGTGGIRHATYVYGEMLRAHGDGYFTT